MTRSEVPLRNDLLEAALAYAARGWPVFPCSPRHKAPLLARDKDEAGKDIPNSGGVTKASTDPVQILAWWERWPKALIGLATGHPTAGSGGGRRMFAVDFDPRVDEDTGEVWTLERLKAELEAQIGGPLPESLTALSPSGGVHLYLLQPAADGEGGGPPITNRGNLPEHVDVRGLGGYVIAPPSVMGPNAVKGQSGFRYRWHRDGPVALAPPALIEVLRTPGKGGKAAVGAGEARQAARGARGALSDVESDAVRKYALAALDGECRAVREAPSGRRNAQLNESALKIASLVAAGAIDATIARSSIEAAARDNPGRDSDSQLAATIDSGWSAGMSNPRDLCEVAAAARERASRPGRGAWASGDAGGRLRPAPRDRLPDGSPSSQTGGSISVGSKTESGGSGEGAGGPGGEALDRECAFRPQTDLGNLERFLARHGGDFLYVEAWGWLAWDGRRWNRDMANALLGHAVQRTMRAIQDEAELVRASGVPEPELEMWDAGQKAAHAEQQKGRLDKVIEVKRGKRLLLSDTIAKWGRTSEGAGHINCIARLAEARLSARTEDFDADPLLLNMENGTLVFLRPDPERGLAASASLRGHRREDRITKLGGCGFDGKALCPLYDAFLARVQPSGDMRDFLDTWAGYNSLGLADAQKMALFYGEGSNGKGVWINVTAFILGDYAWAAGIETFIDQGRYRKGSDASPDLAAMAGRRMVYANEPEDQSKFSDGLIKAMTSDEPIGGVRELNKPPFQLPVTFTNTVSANNMPKIGSDHGIQRRVQVVPWGVIIPDEEADLQLKAKLKAEASGILNRMVRGALRYLTDGLALPEAVKEATREYQEDNDLLGEFLRLCVARVPGERVQARPFHKVFAAWQIWAGKLPQSGKTWSELHLNKQMKKKSFKTDKSSTNQWKDVALRYERSDFVDADDRPVERELPPPKTFPGEVKGAAAEPEPPPPAPLPPPDADDYIGGWNEP